MFTCRQSGTHKRPYRLGRGNGLEDRNHLSTEASNSATPRDGATKDRGGDGCGFLTGRCVLRDDWWQPFGQCGSRDVNRGRGAGLSIPW